MPQAKILGRIDRCTIKRVADTDLEEQQIRRTLELLVRVHVAASVVEERCT